MGNGSDCQQIQRTEIKMRLRAKCLSIKDFKEVQRW